MEITVIPFSFFIIFLFICEDRYYNLYLSVSNFCIYSFPQYKRNCRMTIELIDTEIEEENDSGGSAGSAVSHNTTVPSSTIPPAVAEVERWSAYVEKYVSSVAPQVSMPHLCR